MKYLLIMLLFVFIACDNEDDGCPTKVLLLPEYSNSGKNVMACIIDDEVWIGNQGMSGGNFMSTSRPSFNINSKILKDENGEWLQDENGEYIFDSVHTVSFRSNYFCVNENDNTDFTVSIKVSENSNNLFSLDYNYSSIRYYVWHGSGPFADVDSYLLKFDRPFTFEADFDLKSKRLSARFSGTFEDYDTKKTIEITDGFFDMQQIL